MVTEEICKTTFLAIQRERIIKIQDNSRIRGPVSVQNANSQADEDNKFDHYGYFKMSLEDNQAVPLSITVKPIFI